MVGLVPDRPDAFSFADGRGDANLDRGRNLDDFGQVETLHWGACILNLHRIPPSLFLGLFLGLHGSIFIAFGIGKDLDNL